ncbi:MAG: hypothetical protein QM811_11990 [Pirellulales bacterium]
MTVRMKSQEEAVGVATKVKTLAEADVTKVKKTVADAQRIVDNLTKDKTALEAAEKASQEAAKAEPAKPDAKPAATKKPTFDPAKLEKAKKDLAGAEKYLGEVKRDVATREAAVKSAADAEKSARAEVETTKKQIEKLPQ